MPHRPSLAKHVIFSGFGPDAHAGQGVAGPDDPAFNKRILCEGDSWFTIGGMPTSNLLFPLRFSTSTLLINLARPGDTLRRMSDISTNPVLWQLIQTPNFATPWDAILLSGGGNDLIDQAERIICSPSVGAGQHMLDYIDRVALAEFKVGLQQGYRRIAQARNASEKNANTPIFAHVYDYPTPRNAPCEFFGIKAGGPWLYKAFQKKEVPEAFWISVTDYLFESLAVAIVELSGSVPNFHVITDTRGVLKRARLDTTGADGDWANEIHPTPKGYEKLAAVVSTEIDRVINPRGHG